MRALITLLSTGFYVGYTPRAPGTAGSILGLGLVWTLTGPLGLTVPYYLLVTALFFVLGIWVSSRAETLFGHDGPRIVIDEIAGVLIVFAAMPFDLFTLVAGFVLFRVLDIWKPFPCDRVQRLPGGLGVMMDDAVAAVYAHLLLRIVTGFLS
ncbi:MAG: phosphatidylglycerophosphatase A [Gemmatimonadetes bacterium]|nr:phosphatidylglycerophosphatase A [Gemmatimonadota bacterium]MYH19025.1 phosphatidylglycerophosphatase A [Gemmatimonadota bacterium]MYK99647.1 phosphatidylglycerophosphatase A [Gemmatimonadota bacterium]